jgi:hypothetical protein
MSGFLNNGIMPKDTYGDWCVPPEDLRMINTSDPSRITSAEFIGTAYFYFELKLMQKFALLLGKTTDADEYAKTAEMVKKAFNQKFSISDEVKYSNNTCTANILALAFDLVPDEYREKITDNLLQKILSENGGHVGNGLIGGQWLMRVLTQTGHSDVAYKLAAQNTYPSWGYMVEKGATTIWELWNGDKGDPGMNSGNHVMLLGDLIIWFYEDLAGIKADPENPGFKHIIMNPSVSGDLNNVSATFNSMYGMIKSAWKLEDKEFNWEITIPANTTATVYVPAKENSLVKEGGKKAGKSKGVKFVKWENNRAVFEMQSGSYSFSSDGVIKDITTPYAATPVISPSDSILSTGSILKVEISCADANATIHFTTDGSQVNESSPVYNTPIEIKENTIVRATAYLEGFHPSNQSTVKFNYIDPEKNGVNWSFYEGEYRNLPDFARLKPAKRGEIYNFSLNKITLPQGSYAMQFHSFIQIDKGGKYTFYINSNDGSQLFIDDKLLIDNGGEHGAREISNSIELQPGRHSIRADYFQAGGGKVLTVSYESAEINKEFLPESNLFKNRN